MLVFVIMCRGEIRLQLTWTYDETYASVTTATRSTVRFSLPLISLPLISLPNF